MINTDWQAMLWILRRKHYEHKINFLSVIWALFHTKKTREMHICPRLWINLRQGNMTVIHKWQQKNMVKCLFFLYFIYIYISITHTKMKLCKYSPWRVIWVTVNICQHSCSLKRLVLQTVLKRTIYSDAQHPSIFNIKKNVSKFVNALGEIKLN